MDDENDFSRFVTAEDERELLPIDHKALDSLITEKKAEQSRQGRAKSDELVDPITRQREKEKLEKIERAQRLLDAGVPEHLHDTQHETWNRVEKGEYLDLLQKVPSLRHIRIATGWDQKSMEAEATDIDISVFLLNKNYQTREDSDFVFYNQMSTLDGAVRHMGDSRTGAGDGDDEEIFIDLTGVPYDIVRIMIVLSIYDDAEKGYTFSRVRNMFARLVDDDQDLEVCRFELSDEEYVSETAIMVAALVREGPRWYFEALGKGTGTGGLAKIATQYGIIVKELQSTGE